MMKRLLYVLLFPITGGLIPLQIICIMLLWIYKGANLTDYHPLPIWLHDKMFES